MRLEEERFSLNHSMYRQFNGNGQKILGLVAECSSSKIMILKNTHLKTFIFSYGIKKGKSLFSFKLRRNLSVLASAMKL